LRPEDAVSMYLARIAAFDQSSVGQPLNHGAGNQPLNSFMHVNRRAVEEAGELGEDDDVGEKPLFGIPMILKDNIATRDMPTTAGRCWRPEAPARDRPSRSARTSPPSGSAPRLPDRSSVRPVRTTSSGSSRRSVSSAGAASCPLPPIRTPPARWRGR